jgi:hypothetical protein
MSCTISGQQAQVARPSKGLLQRIISARVNTPVVMLLNWISSLSGVLNLSFHRLQPATACSWRQSQRDTTPIPGLTYNRHLGQAKEAHEDDPA